MVNFENLTSKIDKFKLDPTEAKAWKVAILYLNTLEKVFPAYEKAKNVYSGDPRKTNLWKYCFKLVRERGEEIGQFEWEQYIRAQLDIIKINQGDDGYVTPGCLVGDAAWGRWVVFKKSMNAVAMQPSAEQVGIVVDLEKVRKSLKESREFLLKRLKVVSKEVILKAHGERVLFRWAAQGFISPYFISLCDLIPKTEEIFEKFSIDVKKYLVTGGKFLFDEIFPELT